MTTTPASDFESLRAQAVQYAQAASGNIWTDYNLHDPGVTLLEQTCFALSEISYQAAHPIRDLLTNEDGQLHYTDLALYNPRTVLPSAPVTDLDLTSYLSDQPHVARAWVTQAGKPGLFSVVVTPAAEEGLDERALTQHVAEAFERVRPLATDLDQIVVARKRDTVLCCRIEVTPTADPERVAAWIYFKASTILRGRLTSDDAQRGATRSVVYDHPERIFRPPADTGDRVPDVDAHLSRLRAIPGIKDIAQLSFREQVADTAERSLLPTYPALVLPHETDEIELEIWVGENKLVLDHSRIHEEYIRAAAQSISRAHHHLDDPDWSVLKDGRRRRFDRAHVDAMLPAIYRIYAGDPKQGRAVQGAQKAAAVADPFQQYRSAINSRLDEMSNALAELPALFTAETNRGSPDAETHARRVALVDLLLALHGETLPPVRHTGLHHYRSTSQRQDFELGWRLTYLRALPELNAARGTGPAGTAPGGFMARLGLMADITVQDLDVADQRMRRIGWTLEARADPPEPTFLRRDLLLPLNPFDMLVPRDDDARPLDPQAITDSTPWVNGNKIHPDLLQRAADPSAFAMTPVAGGRYAVVFDSGATDAVYHIKTTSDKAEAMVFVNRLRASWRALHQEAELAFLIEDVLLRDPEPGFDPHRCTLVLTGWTARCTLDSYRSYVAQLVQDLAPAHLVMDLLWLDMAQMITFRSLYDAAISAAAKPTDRRAVREFLDSLRAAL